jgi:hypothetical protein
MLSTIPRFMTAVTPKPLWETLVATSKGTMRINKERRFPPNGPLDELQPWLSHPHFDSGNVNSKTTARRARIAPDITV